MKSIARIVSTSRFVDVRGLRTHLREWRTNAANETSPTLVLLHGWMDVSASFQFVVDALRGSWRVVAPDWRGYGLTQRATGFPGVTGYWFPDYFADLDAMIDAVSANAPVHLVGHSMGGNIACIYAGIRPARVATLVSLEGFGMPSTTPAMAPARYARWLDAVKEPPQMRGYRTLAQVAGRLRKNNPRLSQAHADFLAEYWAACNPDGEWVVLGDPAHKLPSPMLYRVDEVLACWRAVTAPVLWVEARESELFATWAHTQPQREQALRREFAERVAAFADVRTATVEDAGHMLHHDQPEHVAQLIESFIAEATASGAKAVA